MSDAPPTACSRLQEADQAYHDLMRGQAVRSLTDENGENLSFTQANKDQLLIYIRQLQAQCPAYTALALGGALFRRPARFVF